MLWSEDNDTTGMRTFGTQNSQGGGFHDKHRIGGSVKSSQKVISEPKHAKEDSCSNFAAVSSTTAESSDYVEGFSNIMAAISNIGNGDDQIDGQIFSGIELLTEKEKEDVQKNIQERHLSFTMWHRNSNNTEFLIVALDASIRVQFETNFKASFPKSSTSNNTTTSTSSQQSQSESSRTELEQIKKQVEEIIRSRK